LHLDDPRLGARRLPPSARLDDDVIEARRQRLSHPLAYLSLTRAALSRPAWVTSVRLRDSTLLLTPNDIADQLACRHLTQLDRARIIGRLNIELRQDPRIEALPHRGDAHEKQSVASLAAHGLSVVDLRGAHDAAATLDATRAGIDAIVPKGSGLRPPPTARRRSPKRSRSRAQRRVTLGGTRGPRVDPRGVSGGPSPRTALQTAATTTESSR